MSSSIALPPSLLRQVSQSNPELTDMASLASQLALGIPSLPVTAGITGGLPCPLAFTWVLGI